MGLDMTAGWAEPQPKREDNVVPIKEEFKTLEDEFYWRKHSRLHNLLQTMWFCKKHEGSTIPSGEELAKMVCSTTFLIFQKIKMSVLVCTLVLLTLLKQ